MKKRMLSVLMASVISVTILIPGITVYADNPNNPYSGNRTVTGRYDLTSTGEMLNDAYDTPIDKTDITAINDPDQFCKLMELGLSEEQADTWTHWMVDWSKPVVESGQSNIYYKAPGARSDSRLVSDCGWYQIVKTSKAKPWDGGEGQVYEVRVYGFENGYLLVNTTRNGIYFNERGEAVVNGAVVKHTNNCYYGDEHWNTTLAMIKEIYWDGTSGPLTWEGNPIFYHSSFLADPELSPNRVRPQTPTIFENGFGDCCDQSLYIFE